MSARVFRYCRYGDLIRVLMLGWVWAADLGDTHGQWSCLVEWKGDGEPIWI